MGECHSHNKCCCHCHSEQETCHKEEHHEGEFGSWFLEVADEAWTEVLKEEIKKHILATQKERMAELAQIVSEANNHRWKLKMEKKQGCCDFKEKVHTFFGKSNK